MGHIHNHSTYGDFSILGVCKRKTYSSSKRFIIKFHNTGYIRSIGRNALLLESFKDYFHKNVYGVGYIGEKEKSSDESLYTIWHNILARCYNQSTPSYRYYGAMGVTVCKRWHNYSNFEDDIIEIEGFDLKMIKNGELQLDKDKLQEKLDTSQKIYSKETCLWVTPHVNNSEIKKSSQNYIKASKSGVNIYHFNQNSLGEILNIDQREISSAIINNHNNYHGWDIKNISKFPNGWTTDNCDKKSRSIINKYNEHHVKDITNYDVFIEIEKKGYKFYLRDYDEIMELMDVYKQAVRQCVCEYPLKHRGITFKKISLLPRGWDINNYYEKSINVLNKYEEINNRKIEDNNNYFKIWKNDLIIFHYNKSLVSKIIGVKRGRIGYALANNKGRLNGWNIKGIEYLPNGWTPLKCDEVLNGML